MRIICIANTIIPIINIGVHPFLHLLAYRLTVDIHEFEHFLLVFGRFESFLGFFVHFVAHWNFIWERLLGSRNIDRDFY